MLCGVQIEHELAECPLEPGELALQDGEARPGDPGRSLFFVHGGRIKVSKVTRDGKSLTLAYHGPAELFGDSCLLDGGPRTEMAEAVENALLSEIGSGAELLERMRPDSERSGAAMRACPIGLYPDEDTVLSMAELQARITHDTPRGVEAAQAVALATFYCRNALGPREAVGEHLAGVLGRFWAEPHVGPVGDLGVDAARAAVTALSRATSMKGLLADCVDFTGDVDTVAAVAMGMASFCDDLPRDLPAFLERDLENGGWGRGFLVKLDGALLRAFPPAPSAGPTP